MLRGESLYSSGYSGSRAKWENDRRKLRKLRRPAKMEQMNPLRAVCVIEVSLSKSTKFAHTAYTT